MSQEQSAWFQHWTCIPMGASNSIRADRTAEAPQGLGSMCVSSFKFAFSHPLSQKLESCVESFVLGIGTINPSAPTSPCPFESSNQKGARRGSGKMNGATVLNGVAEEGFPTSRNLGESGVAWNGRACKQLAHGLKVPKSWSRTLFSTLEKCCLPGDL